MKIAILTCGILPIPAVQGGAVENLIDFYLDYNDRMRLHDITVYSPWDARVESHPARSSAVNHYHFIDVTSLKSRISRRLYMHSHSDEYYNHFIEYYFERIYADLNGRDYDCILLENCPGYVLKLSGRGFSNLVLHLHNELLHAASPHHNAIFGGLSKIITVSDYIRGSVATIKGDSKICTVYNGIDLGKFCRKECPSVTREELGFTKDDFVMIYSGRINRDKGVSELIDAMLRLRGCAKMKLLIVGGTFFGNAPSDDDFVRSLKAKAMAIKDRIVFTGFVPYDSMPGYLQLADVAVVPSVWHDPFPTTVLEAQAMGLPVVSTRQGGIPEEVSASNAILVDNDKNIVEHLAQAIQHLYDHPAERQQMSSASLRRARLFDRDTFACNFFAALAAR